jgi:hypothetical protein
MIVKAYPNPEDEYGEACCTAGVDSDGNWLRIWPVPFRDLPLNKRFAKWQWIKAKIRHSSDPRPESHDIQPDTIELGDKIDTGKAWAKRLSYLAPHYVQSVEALQALQQAGQQTMGTIRPSEVIEFVIEERDDPNWKPGQLGKLSQQGLFTGPKATLERIPLKFSYRFKCDDAQCKIVHKFQILDWEVAESYRSWRVTYGADWEKALRQKYEKELLAKDLVFNLGNYIKYPTSFGIVGLVYPPKT